MLEPCPVHAERLLNIKPWAPAVKGRHTHHHAVNADGNLMVLKAYAPLTSASSADELLLLASENSSSHNSVLRRCKTSVDVSLSSMDPTPDAPVTEEKASEASPRLTARALRRHDVACARALRPEQNPFKLHSDGAFDPSAAPSRRHKTKAPNCAFLWFLRNIGWATKDPLPVHSTA